jgi:AraC family transcriptional regulator
MTDRELFSSPLVTIAEFTCPASDDAWHTTNVIESPAPLVAFPHMAVGVKAAGAPALLATPNLVMLYNPGQEYERRLVDEGGDRCIYLVLHPPALQELEAAGCTIRDGRMTRLHAPVGGRAYLAQHLLARHLRGGAPDPLLVEDAALRLVQAVLRSEPHAEASRSRTRSAHRELAEAAKEQLARSLGEPLALHTLAARLAVSPFHLARVFRAQTGYSLHEYRTQLRLRLALVQLPESRGALTPLARNVGFASHSHFTDAFRREFGVPPSAVRDGRELLAS